MPSRETRKRRRLLRQIRDQAYFTQPLGRKAAQRETKSASDLRYGPEERRLGGQLRASDLQQQQLGGWFQSYREALGRSQAETRAANERAQQTIAQQGQAAQGIDAAERERLAAEEAKSAQLRGTTPSPETQTRSFEASRARQSLSDIFGAATARRGAEREAYSADLQRIGTGAEVSEKRKEAARRRSIQGEQRDLEREKGAFGVEYLGKIREGERKYALERQAFGLDVAKEKADVAADTAKAKADAAKERRRQMEADRKFQLDVKKHGLAVAKDNYQRRKGLGSYKPAAGGGGSKALGGYAPKDYLRAKDILTEKYEIPTLAAHKDARREAITFLSSRRNVPADLARIVVRRLIRSHRRRRPEGYKPISDPGYRGGL